MVLGIDKRYIYLAWPMLGFAIGHFLDLKETERMTLFRDRSALFGRPGGRDPPSW